jgi:hypothetical protein
MCSWTSWPPPAPKIARLAWAQGAEGSGGSTWLLVAKVIDGSSPVSLPLAPAYGPTLGPGFCALRFNPFAVGLGSHDDFPPVVVVVRSAQCFQPCADRQLYQTPTQHASFICSLLVARCLFALCLLFVCSLFARVSGALHLAEGGDGHPLPQNRSACVGAVVLLELCKNRTRHTHPPAGRSEDRVR